MTHQVKSFKSCHKSQLDLTDPRLDYDLKAFFAWFSLDLHHYLTWLKKVGLIWSMSSTVILSHSHNLQSMKCMAQSHAALLCWIEKISQTWLCKTTKKFQPAPQSRQSHTFGHLLHVSTSSGSQVTGQLHKHKQNKTHTYDSTKILEHLWKITYSSLSCCFVEITGCSVDIFIQYPTPP